MITFKLPIQNQIDILEQRRIFSSIVRFAYNRFKDGLPEKEVRKQVNERFELGSWLLQCAILKGKDIYNTTKGKRVIFGGKKNFHDLKNGKITKDQWKEKRLMPLYIQGEKSQYGNRLVKLDIIDNNQIILKLDRNNHQVIQLPKLRKNIKKQLCQLQLQTEKKLLPFTVQLNHESLAITFEPSKEKTMQHNPKRVMGIDLNPNYIGFSVLEFNNEDTFKVIHKEVLDLSKLNIKSNEESSSSYSRYLNDKRKHELFEISKHIVDLATHYTCGKVVVEELNIKSKNHKKGKYFNRLVNNIWNRSDILDNLKKRCDINDIEFVTVNPAHSSIVGNINYGNNYTPDMVASSIELARRGYKKYSKSWFYPVLKNIDNLKTLWKEALDWSSIDWKEIFALIKSKPEMRYRFLLDKCSSSLSHFNYKTKICTFLYK